MFAATPPAIMAPVRPCADYAPVNLHISWTTVAPSPDCRWLLISVADSGNDRRKLDALHLPAAAFSGKDRAFVVERSTNRIVAHFEMERSASAHWLKDNRHLVINSFEGSGSTVPLMISLTPDARKPADLADLLWLSALAHAGIPDKRPYGFNAWTYHYYVNFVKETGDRMIISVEPWYTKNGANGTGIAKCYVYSVSKTTLRYRFIQEKDVETCPHNADEKWD